METSKERGKVPEGDFLVRPLARSDIETADRVFRLAFGTFLGLPDPMTFFGDTDYVRTRWIADPEAALAAEIGGELVGSNFATHWGSVGFFGPLTIRPDYWDRGVARRLLEPTMELFAKWGTRHIGLFTFSHSPKHVALYQKYGFWARYLTAVMSKAVQRPAEQCRWSTYSELPLGQREGGLKSCRELTGAVYDGLDVTREIHAIDSQKLGETALLWDDSQLNGLATCHCGAGSEAGSSTCYVKFGATRPGPRAGEHFDRLLDSCESLAAARGLTRLVAGVNLGRHQAYRQMLARGFRTDIQGVAMQRPNEDGYNRAEVFVIDDWR